jgi:hypothetical protein
MAWGTTKLSGNGSHWGGDDRAGRFDSYISNILGDHDLTFLHGTRPPEPPFSYSTRFKGMKKRKTEKAVAQAAEARMKGFLLCVLAATIRAILAAEVWGPLSVEVGRFLKDLDAPCLMMEKKKEIRVRCLHDKMIVEYVVERYQLDPYFLFRPLSIAI